MIVGWYRRVDMGLGPFLNSLYATPRIAMVPLIIIWFGIGMWSKVFIVFFSAFIVRLLFCHFFSNSFSFGGRALPQSPA